MYIQYACKLTQIIAHFKNCQEIFLRYKSMLSNITSGKKFLEGTSFQVGMDLSEGQKHGRLKESRTLLTKE